MSISPSIRRSHLESRFWLHARWDHDINLAFRKGESVTWFRIRKHLKCWVDRASSQTTITADEKKPLTSHSKISIKKSFRNTHPKRPLYRSRAHSYTKKRHTSRWQNPQYTGSDPIPNIHVSIANHMPWLGSSPSFSRQATEKGKYVLPSIKSSSPILRPSLPAQLPQADSSFEPVHLHPRSQYLIRIRNHSGHYFCRCGKGDII